MVSMQVSSFSKFHAYERSEVPNIWKFSVHRILWIYSSMILQTFVCDLFSHCHLQIHKTYENELLSNKCPVS